MSIKLADSNMKKGLAIIVGNEPDGILLHTALIFDENIVFLDEAKIPQGNDILIYLIGHGADKKDVSLKEIKINYMIDDKTVVMVAQKLVECGYDGSQQLYPIICHYEIMKSTFEQALKEQLDLKYGVGKVTMAPLIEKSEKSAILVDNQGVGELWVGYEANQAKLKDKRNFQKKFLKACELEKSNLKNKRGLTPRQFELVSNFKKLLIEIFKE